MGTRMSHQNYGTQNGKSEKSGKPQGEKRMKTVSTRPKLVTEKFMFSLISFYSI
jgi:hypothetical protein